MDMAFGFGYGGTGFSMWFKFPGFTIKKFDLMQIRDSNRPMLLSSAVQQHCKVLDLGIAHDDEEEIQRVLDSAFSSGIDILLTSGGVSMGDRDFVKPFFRKRGTLHFSKVVYRCICRS